ncbi:MAG: hypothetical protein QOG54_1409 [Actinomycetota bacterium]|jgi:hypothetical protein|nr:hypothetical protein [Actinomycetota bacterium]
MGNLFLLWIILFFFFGFITSSVWSSKGGSAVGGFWMGAILGVIGLVIAVVVTPQGGIPVQVVQPTSSERPATKRCPMCAEDDIRVEAVRCKHCGHMFSDAIEESAPIESFEGKAVFDVTEFALGVTWGRLDDGRLVFKESQASDWTLYVRGQTAFVPPSGYGQPAANL